MLNQTSYLDQQILIAISEHLGSGGFTGPLNGMSIALIQTNFNSTPGTVWADLVECNFSGYNRALNVGWGVPLLQGDGSYQILSSLVTFVAAGASNFVANTVWGWALVDTNTPPNVLMSEVFKAPLAIVNPNDGFGIVIQKAEGAANPASQGNII